MAKDLIQELTALRESEKKLQKVIEQQKKRIELLERNMDALTQALLHARKERFGPSSEKTPVCSGQLFLFNEAESETDPNATEPEEEMVTVAAHKRPKRKAGDKERLIADIPRETVECVINENDAACDICNSALEIIGKKKVRTELKYIPSKLKVIEFVQYIYNRFIIP